MTFSGDLRGISLADIFQNIAANRSTGTLRVQWRNTERFVRFQDGGVYGFSLGVRKGLPILDHLVQRGYVDPAHLRKLMAKRSRRTPGRRIVDAGLLTEQEMRDAIAELVREHVYDLMLLRDAEFSFTLGDPPPQVFGADQQAFAVRMESSPLLVEGARRQDEWERIHKVIGSDRDLFVRIEGGDESTLDPITAEVAQRLDGTTDLHALQHHVRASRFEIMRAVCELVQNGCARPCSAQEIQANARSALEAGDADTALRLLRQALELERSNTDLRCEFAGLLEQLGRPADAAAEYAALGFQAARDGEAETALGHYDRATALNPSDPMLHEQRVDLLRRGSDRDALAAAVLELAGLWLEMGLAERARDLLSAACQNDGLDHHPDVLEQLGAVEARLGHIDEAADVFCRLADDAAAQDEALAVDYLRVALQHCPDHEALATRLHDIETGRRNTRRVRRRQLLTIASAAAVLVLLGSAGVAELTASRQVVRALDRGLESIAQGKAAPAISDLQDVQSKLGWTPSGHRAAVLLGKLVEAQLEAARTLAANDHHDRALAVVRDLKAMLPDSPLQASCDRVREQLELEQNAIDLLESIARREPAPTRSEALEQLAEPRLLDLLVRRLPRLPADETRHLVLRALMQIDNPRALGEVARVYLIAEDTESLTLLRILLDRAPAHRIAGAEAQWSEVYPDLEAALSDPVRGKRARTALSALRGDEAPK